MTTAPSPPLDRPAPATTSPRRRRLRPPSRRFWLAVAAGGVLWGAFPPVGWWPLAPAGCALLTLAVRGSGPRRAAAHGLVCGLVLFVPLLSFVRVVGDDGWLLLALSQAAWFAGLAAGLAVVGRLPAWPVWTGCLWVAEEWARGRVPFGGFPWGRLAFGVVSSPYLGLAAVGGAPVVGFAVAVTGALAVALALRLRPGRAALAPAAPLAAGILAVVLAGLAVPQPTGGQAGPHGPAYTTVTVVQGNVPRLGLKVLDQQAAVLGNHVVATERFAAAVAAGRLPRPDLVIWPENADDFDPFHVPAAAAEISAAVNAVGVPALVGVILDGPGPTHVRNTGMVWNPRTGPAGFYVKRHPLPFGEYVPFRSVLGRLIGRFALVPYDFAAGHRPGVLTVGPARVGDVICFEVAYDSIVRDAVRSGGRLLVVQTNNATFERRGDTGSSGETAQQLLMSRLRAVEHGRAVIVAATSGVSAVIGPDGTVRQSTRVFTQRVLTARVPLRDATTLADRLGAWPEWVLAVAGVLAALAAGLGPAVRRRAAGRTARR